MFAAVDHDHEYFAFIDGTVVGGWEGPGGDWPRPRGERRVLFLHTTSYRLGSGQLFGLTNDSIAAYAKETLGVTWSPWLGTTSMSTKEREREMQQSVRLRKENIARLEAAPFPRLTVIQAERDELAVLEAEHDAERAGWAP